MNGQNFVLQPLLPHPCHLRHKSIRTTEVYLRKPDESLRDAAKRLENAHLLTDPVEEKEKAT